MLINGENRLACALLIRDIGHKISVEPIRGLPVIKDLVVDMEPFFAQYRSVLPYLINSHEPGYRERVQSPEDRERFDDTTKCILCAACTTSCPIYWGNDSYVGPAAIVNAHRLIFDSRDEAAAERLDILNQRSGLWRCRPAFSCTQAHPRGPAWPPARRRLPRARPRPSPVGGGWARPAPRPWSRSSRRPRRWPPPPPPRWHLSLRPRPAARACGSGSRSAPKAATPPPSWLGPGPWG